jgi:hypothetical protein
MKDFTYTTESIKEPSCTTCANYKQKMTDSVEAAIRREEDLAKLIKRREAEVESLKRLLARPNLCETCCYEPHDSRACRATYTRRGQDGYKIIDCDGYRARLFGWEKEVLGSLQELKKSTGVQFVETLNTSVSILKKFGCLEAEVSNALAQIANILK